MSVLDNLNKIKSCKEDIKQAIIDKGVDMTGVSLEGYATKISEIQAGGGDYLDMRMNMSTYYSTVEQITSYTFYNCTALQSINLPNCSVVYEQAFANCSSLTSIDLPKCESIYTSAFLQCKSLTSIDLPKCNYMGSGAFYSCWSLQSVNLPECERIYNAFMYCSSLTSIDLPKCKHIERTFQSCWSLQSVNLPECIYISGSTFAYCSSLSVLDLRSTYSCSLYNSNAFSRTPFASGVGSIYVHNTVLSQFQNATNWTFFSNCLVGVGDPTRPLLSFDNGRVYGDTYYLYSSNWLSYLGITSSSVISIDLPNCCYVSKSTFSYCSSLQTVNLPNCSYVGSNAFMYCPSLQTVNLPMCRYVGVSAFYICSSLQSVNLPMCEYVDDYAFESCSSLQTVNLPKCSYVGSSAFIHCSSLQSVNLPMCEYIGNTALYTYNNTIDTVYIGTSISKVCQAGGIQIFAANNTQGGYRVKSIFVPMSLVDAYKSAQYWSQYASLIFGI